MKYLGNITELDLRGVYKIQNTQNNKIYVGSTNKTFLKRMRQHNTKLRQGRHHSIHMQRAYELYGEDSFEFSIVEVLSENFLERESHWIQFYNSCNPEFGYNTNPDCTKSPMLQKEVSEKVSKSLSSFYKEWRESDLDSYYKRWEYKRESIPWNKDKKMTSSQTEKMHSRKTITDKVIEARSKMSKSFREKQDYIDVYDEDLNFIKRFGCMSNLFEWSQTEENNLPMKLRKGESKIIPVEKICKSIKSNKAYKGLFFKKAPKEEKSLLENGVNSGNAEMPILSQAKDTSLEGAETSGEV